MQEKFKNRFGKFRQSKIRRLSIMLAICMTFSLCSVMGITAFAASTRPSDIADNTKYHEMLTDGIFSSNKSWDGVNASNTHFTEVEVNSYSTYCTTAANKPAYYQTTSNNVLELNGTSGSYPETIYQKVKVLPETTVHISYQYITRNKLTTIGTQSMLLSVVPAASFNGTAVVEEDKLTREIFANNKLTDVTVLSGNATVSNGVITAADSWSEIYAAYQVPADVYEVYVAFHGLTPTDDGAGNILAYASARTATIDTVYVSASGSDASGNGSEGSPFQSLELASYWVSEGGKIILLDDVSGNMTASKPFTLDLNGHAVTGNLTVNASGNLKITDSSSAGTGKITGNVTGASGSTVSINSGRIDGTLTLAGTASITGGTFMPEPAAAYIASGYGCVANGDGSFTVKPLSDISSSAVSEIEKALSDAKNAIYQMTGLTDDEKTALIKEAENAFDSAKSSIESATDANGIESAKSAGIDALKQVEDNAALQNAKNESAEAIDEALTANKAAVDALKNLSDDEKTALKNELDGAAAAAKAAINAATSTDAVNAAKTDGIADLDFINAKAEAIDAVNKELSDTKTAIAQMTDLSDDEREVYSQAADEYAGVARNAISNATSSEEVLSSKDNGIAALELNMDRAATTDGINRELADTLAAIDALEYLNNEEKAVQKAAAINAADTAYAAVSNAGTDDLTGISETLSESLKDVMDHAISADFIDAYLNDNSDGTVYDDVNSANIDRIFSGQESWNDLTDKQKEIINQTITALNKEKTDVEYQTYQDYLDAVFAAIEDSETSFIEQYVSDDQGNIYKEANVNNYEQLFSGKEIWDELSQAEKDAIDEALVAAGSKPYEELLNEAKDAVDSSAEDFIGKYVSDSDGNIYKKSTDENYAQIISGLETWNNMNQAEKDAVNQRLVAEADGKTYEELLRQAQDYLDTVTNAFIKEHMTDDAGSVIIAVSEDTYDNILNGESDFNKLSQDQKDEVNRKLKEAGSEKTYEELLAEAKKAVNASADDFIDKYVSDAKKNIYKSADKDNYKQILSGEDVWNSLTQSERDAINRALLAAGGKSYEELLAEAKNVEAVVESQNTGDNGTVVKSPNTGNSSNIMLWFILTLVSAAALMYISALRKKENAK